MDAPRALVPAFCVADFGSSAGLLASAAGLLPKRAPASADAVAGAVVVAALVDVGVEAAGALPVFPLPNKAAGLEAASPAGLAPNKPEAAVDVVAGAAEAAVVVEGLEAAAPKRPPGPAGEAALEVAAGFEAVAPKRPLVEAACPAGGFVVLLAAPNRADAPPEAPVVG